LEKGFVPFLYTQIRFFLCVTIIPFYMFIGLIKYSVDSRIRVIRISLDYKKKLIKKYLE